MAHVRIVGGKGCIAGKDRRIAAEPATIRYRLYTATALEAVIGPLWVVFRKPWTSADLAFG